MPGRASYELPVGGRAGRGRGRGARGRGAGARGRAAAGRGDAGSDSDEDEPRLPVTPEKQAELLGDYIELAPKYWRNVSAGDQVRYYTKIDGGFRYGGIVRIARFKSQSRTSPERELMLLGGANSMKKTWAVGWDTILRLYIIPSVPLMVMHDNLKETLETINGNIQQVAAAVKKLDTRLKAVEAKVGLR